MKKGERSTIKDVSRDSKSPIRSRFGGDVCQSFPRTPISPRGSQRRGGAPSATRRPEGTKVVRRGEAPRKGGDVEVVKVVEIDFEGVKPSSVGYIHQYRMWYWLKYLVAKESRKPECSSGKCDLFCLERPKSSVFRKQELSINFKKPELTLDTVELLRTCKKRFTFLIMTFIIPREVREGYQSPESAAGTKRSGKEKGAGLVGKLKDDGKHSKGNGLVGKLKDDEKHANMLVIDNFNKTYERFEPYGYEERDGDLGHAYLKIKIQKYLGQVLPDYRLVPFEKSNLPEGPQELQFSQDKSLIATGTCVPLSCMLMHLKLLNPGVSTVELQRHMTNRSGSQIHEMALRYVSLVYKYTPEIKRVKKLEAFLRENVVAEAIFEIAMFEAQIPNPGEYFGD